MSTLIVLAKECVPGRAKTRLHPPLTLVQAADVAAAALADTLHAGMHLGADRRILCFDGRTPPPGSEGYEIVVQPDGGLDERIEAAFAASSGPTLLVGMDTPQLGTVDLAAVLADWPDDVDAWFGPARDGGFWALGLADPVPGLVRGVPMSTDETGRVQRDRLLAAGLAVRDLPELVDIDTFDDLLEVTAQNPGTATARTVAALPIGGAA